MLIPPSPNHNHAGIADRLLFHRSVPYGLIFFFDCRCFTKLRKNLSCIILPRPSTQLSLTVGRPTQWNVDLSDPLPRTAWSKTSGSGLKPGTVHLWKKLGAGVGRIRSELSPVYLLVWDLTSWHPNNWRNQHYISQSTDGDPFLLHDKNYALTYSRLLLRGLQGKEASSYSSAPRLQPLAQRSFPTSSGFQSDDRARKTKNNPRHCLRSDLDRTG